MQLLKWWIPMLIWWTVPVTVDTDRPYFVAPQFSVSERAGIAAKHPSITQYYEIDENKINLYEKPTDKTQKKPESIVYMEESDLLAKIIWNYDVKSSIDLLTKKGHRKFNREKFQPLEERAPLFIYGLDEDRPLEGCRIAIDPGHFAGNEQEAIYESRMARIKMPDGRVLQVFEAELCFTTYAFLRDTLVKLGAEVFSTRERHGHTAFDKSYTDWLRDDLQTVLKQKRDSGELDANRYALLSKSKDPAYIYRHFFQAYELEKRAEKINAFMPHFTLIIHYNADAVNNRSDGRGNLLPTQNNYNMAFVPGAFIAGEMQKPEARLNFMRLLVTDHIEESVELSMYLLNGINRSLNIKSIPPDSKLNYLHLWSNFTGYPGVYARNLALTRMVKGPLCYGESLYQDNVKEIALLAHKTLEIDGIATSERVRSVAYGYLDGIMDFLKAKRIM